LIEKPVGIIQKHILVGGDNENSLLQEESIAAAQVDAVVNVEKTFVYPIRGDHAPPASSWIDLNQTSGFIGHHSVYHKSDIVSIIDGLEPQGSLVLKAIGDLHIHNTLKPNPVGPPNVTNGPRERRRA
jgi:hypothetical protein